MQFADQQNFKRPYRPERHYGEKAGILHYEADVARTLQLGIVTEQARTMGGFVSKQLLLLFQRFIWDIGCCPYLAVWMRIAGAHHDAAVLENLNVTNGL